MEITLTVSKRAVMKEVAQTTSYTGAKMDDEGAFERISTTDENEPELNRFWDESRAEVAQFFIRMLSSEGMADDDTYQLVLNVSVSFDTALLPTMQLGLFSYFVQDIVSKWYVYTNKPEAAAFADRGSAILEEVKEKAFFKKRPERPVFS